MISSRRCIVLSSAILCVCGLFAMTAFAQQPAAQPPAAPLPAPQPEPVPEPKFGDALVIRASGAVVNHRPGWTYFKYQGRWVATRTYCR